MALESFEDIKTRLTENIKRADKTIRDQEERLANLNSQLQSTREAYNSARVQCEEAEKRFVTAQGKKEESAKALRELERQKAGIPNAVKRNRELRDDDRSRLIRLDERAKLMKTKINLDNRRHLFVWRFIAETSEPSFENLVRQLDLLLQAIAELRSARADHRRLFDIMRVAESEGRRQESELDLAQAGHRLMEARKQYATARDKVIEAQLADMKEQLEALPTWSPAAHDDAHDVTTAKKFKIEEEIEERRRLLEEAWPKLPD